MAGSRRRLAWVRGPEHSGPIRDGCPFSPRVDTPTGSENATTSLFFSKPAVIMLSRRPVDVSNGGIVSSSLPGRLVVGATTCPATAVALTTTTDVESPRYGPTGGHQRSCHDLRVSVCPYAPHMLRMFPISPISCMLHLARG